MLISWEKQLDMIVMGVSGNGLHQPNGIGKNGAYREHPRNAATAHPHTFIQKHPTKSELPKKQRIKKNCTSKVPHSKVIFQWPISPTQFAPPPALLR